MIEHRDARYYEQANAHIELSNSHLQQAIPGQVLSAMIHATSRFGAWAWAASSASAEDYKARHDQALNGYLDECRRQFEDHFNEHARDFDRLLGRQKTAG
ncbi:MAG TPA: DUF3144 domain-containing protein [Asticcacaulis sp.]|nr:DUF3144 domain-containing protein [Asticcacaulis sp.]